MSEDILVLVGCSSTKREGENYSWKLYESDYFEKRMTLAMLLGRPAILSAKEGFVGVSEKLENYDQTLNNMTQSERESWALSVANSIPEEYSQIVILAGKKYRNTLQKLLEEDGFDVYSPFEMDELRGIGDQISWCREKAEKIEKENIINLQREIESWDI